jgi:tetratricopeptide (TPR) repeat protein
MSNLSLPSEAPANVLTSAAGPEDLAYGQLAEEVNACLEAGREPDVEELKKRYPHLAGQVHDLVGALAVLRQLSAEGLIPASAGRPLAPETSLLGCLGDYRILREVGRGGMGVVYEAEQISLARRVALKVLPFASTLDARQLQRFKNEAQAAAQLHHMHIVPVHATGCERGVHFYAMQYVEGQTLAALISALRQQVGRGAAPNTGTPASLSASPASADPQVTGPYRPETAVKRAGDSTLGLAKLGSGERCIQALGFFRAVAELGIQAAEALEHAHQLGIVHRDIKPGNLLLEQTSLPEGEGAGGQRLRLWVTDFGLAHCQSQVGLTLTGDLVGTLRYMSPEQALAKRVVVDHRTDIYSLGVTLYELLTLEPAFGRQDRQELLRQIAFDEPRPPRRLNRAVPAELETIVLKAMERSPDDRYATAQELADDLERFLKDEPIRARRPTLVQRARKWVRRHKPATRAIACVALILLLAAGALWFERYRHLTMVEQKARESLEAARTFFADNQLALARKKLAEAEGLIGNERASLAHVREKVEALTAEVNRFEDFFRLIDRAHEEEIPSSISLGVPVQVPGGMVLAPPSIRSPERDPAKAVPFLLEALSRYEVWDGERWDTTLNDSLLGPKQVEQVRRTAYEELLWLADDVGSRRQDHRSGGQLAAESAARQALLYLAKAELAHPATSVFYRQRAWCRAALGDREGARRDQQLSRQVTSSMAVEHCLLGLRAYEAHDKAEGVKQFEAALEVEPTHYWSLMWLGYCLCDLGQGPEDFTGAVRVFTGCILKRPDHPHAYFCRGNAYHRLRLYDKALANYSRALELYPGHWTALKARAECYLDLHQFDKAVADFTKLIELEPKLASAWYNRAVAYVRLGQDEKAIADCRKAIRLKKDYAEAHSVLGGLLGWKGHADESIAELQEAIRLKNDIAEAHNNLGLALNRKGRQDEAIAEYREAIRLQKDFAPSHAGLAEVLDEKGQLDEAIAEYREAIRLGKDYAAAHHNLGILLLVKGRSKEAIPELREAVRALKDNLAANPHLAGGLQGKAPSEVQAADLRCLYHYSLGAALYQNHELDEAIAKLREAVRFSDFNQAHYVIGRALREKGKLDEAIAEFREALSLKKDDPLTHFHLGNALLDKGQPDAASAEYREALRLHPHYPGASLALVLAHFNRGNDLSREGKWDEAITHYREVLRLKPDYPAAHCNLGEALREQGQLDQAIAELRQAIRSNEPFPERYIAHIDLGVALEAKGLLDEAIAEYRQALRLKKDYAAAHNNLGLALTAKGRLDEAIAEYREALQLEPDHPRAHGNLRSAACAAARSGCGQGESSAKLDEQERARLRRQALECLRADLEAWGRLSEQKWDKACPLVIQQMQHWLASPDLAGVRSDKALAKLPEAERQEWQKAWADVADTLTRAKGKPALEKKPDRK